MLNFFKRKSNKTSSTDTDVLYTESISPIVEMDSNITEKTAVTSDNNGLPISQPIESNHPSSWLARLQQGLSKTRQRMNEGIATLFFGDKEIDGKLLEELETQLLLADVGVDATMAIIDNLTKRVERKELTHSKTLQTALQQELLNLLMPVEQPLLFSHETSSKPFVILVVGVNGVGKTTTIGKLAHYFQQQKLSVMLAAGDTFRAAAIEQLKIWGERNQVPIIAQHHGADSASVIYDALASAQARQADILIADTAGRLHNKNHLLEELKKVQRVMSKLDEQAPQEVLLVLDASTGQNAINQAITFNNAVPISGIVLTKLDGTAKGGIVFALAKQLQIPIRFIGIGEAMDDLRPFQAKSFVDALFSQQDQ